MQLSPKMKTCIYCDSTKVENQDTGICASCASIIRKEERKPKLKKWMPKSVKAFSKKMIAELKTYSQLRKEHLANHKFCRANLQGCTKKATQVHHLSGRGSNLNREETFMSVCFNCHQLLHNKLSAKERREKGLLK